MSCGVLLNKQNGTNCARGKEDGIYAVSVSKLIMKFDNQAFRG